MEHPYEESEEGRVLRVLRKQKRNRILMFLVVPFLILLIDSAADLTEDPTLINISFWMTHITGFVLIVSNYMEENGTFYVDSSLAVSLSEGGQHGISSRIRTSYPDSEIYQRWAQLLGRANKYDKDYHFNFNSTSNSDTGLDDLRSDFDPELPV